jgi:hypothetical protein
MPTGTRLLLQANVGQFDSVTTLVSARLLTFNNSDTSGGALRNSVFAVRGAPSLAVGDPLQTTFAANSGFFIRRVRIASEQGSYGAKTRNRGGWKLTGSTPALIPLSGYIQLWLMNGATNQTILKMYETDSISTLNEWQDANILIPPSGGGAQNVPLFLAAQYNVDADYIDIATRLVATDPIQFRIELEIDCVAGGVTPPPTYPPTVPLARENWTLGGSVVVASLTQSTYRARYRNNFGQPIKSIQVGYYFGAAASNSEILGAFIGDGTLSGSQNLDAATWDQLLFSGNPTFTPGTGYDLNSVGYIVSDVGTLTHPIPVGSDFVVSSVLDTGFTSLGDTTTETGATPLSGILQAASEIAGNFGNTNGNTWSANSPQPQFVLMMGF